MKIKLNSLRYRILITVLGMSVPAIILFFTINTYSAKKIQQQIFSSNLDLMNAHISELEAELQNASRSLLSESIEKNNIDKFASLNDKDRYEATIYYHKKYLSTLNGFEMMEGQIIYSPINKNTIAYFNELDSDYQERKAVLQYVKDHTEELITWNGQWKTCFINGKWILLGISGNEKICFCFWTTYNLLMKPVKSWRLSETGSFCFVGSDGTVYSDIVKEEWKELSFSGDLNGYYFDGYRDKYLISGVESNIGDFRLMNIVERRRILSVFNHIQIFGCIILLIELFAGIPLIIYIMNKSIFDPIDRMAQGIREIKSGDLSTRIQNLRCGKEVEYLIQSFNEMIVQVQALKIQSYEDSLEKQK